MLRHRLKTGDLASRSERNAALIRTFLLAVYNFVASVFDVRNLWCSWQVSYFIFKNVQ